MLRLHGHCLCNFLIDDAIDLDTFLSLAFEKSVKAPFWKLGWRATHIQLRCEPPILNTAQSDTWGCLNNATHKYHD
jgi:hypothetical protein